MEELIVLKVKESSPYAIAVDIAGFSLVIYCLGRLFCTPYNRFNMERDLIKALYRCSLTEERASESED